MGSYRDSSERHLRAALLGSSHHSSSPIADAVLARDIAACSDDDVDSDDDDLPDDHGLHGPMYRRPSGVAYGGSRPFFNTQIPLADPPALTAVERKVSESAERSLLRDNEVLPPKNPKKRNSSVSGVASRLFDRLLGPGEKPADAAAADAAPSSSHPPGAAAGRASSEVTEVSPLLGQRHVSTEASSDGGEPIAGDDLELQWEEALASGRIKTTWQRETKTILSYSAPLVMTFCLQYSINVASIFTVGRIGTMELGAVSLANMTAAITCIAPFQGLATSLDTLCAQAYGSGHKHLVGLQFQRMTFFLLSLSLPVAVLWFFSEGILRHMIPDPESARLAGLYLRVMIFSIPGLILFEGGKRFTQAQGLFRATTYVLLLVAPLNAFLNWLFVWHFGWGFVGAPIAVAISENLLPVFLFLYVRFVDGRQCWGGFSKRAWTNWWGMICLALPGMIMVEAEWLAFEIMTFLASRFGSDYLAAQSVVSTLASISYQIPFPVSIAASTRIANLIGAGLVGPAKITAKVTFIIAILVGVLNLVVFSSLRYYLPLLFTDDEAVITIVADILPVVALMQVFDGLSAGAHGTLRGVGKQSIGGPANLIAYYVVSLPLSLGMAFGLGWGLQGLWIGVTIGLATVSLIEYTYLLKTDWHKAAIEAEARNAAG